MFGNCTKINLEMIPRKLFTLHIQNSVTVWNIFRTVFLCELNSELCYCVSLIQNCVTVWIKFWTVFLCVLNSELCYCVS